MLRSFAPLALLSGSLTLSCSNVILTASGGAGGGGGVDPTGGSGGTGLVGPGGQGGAPPGGAGGAGGAGLTGGSGGAGLTGGSGGAGLQGGAGGSPPDVCGDGVVTGGELCDDGDADDGDACTSACAIHEFELASDGEYPAVAAFGSGLEGFFVAWRKLPAAGGGIVGAPFDATGDAGPALLLSALQTPGQPAIATLLGAADAHRGRALVAHHGACSAVTFSCGLELELVGDDLMTPITLGYPGAAAIQGVRPAVAASSDQFGLVWPSYDANFTYDVRLATLTATGVSNGAVVSAPGTYTYQPGAWAAASGIYVGWDANVGSARLHPLGFSPPSPPFSLGTSLNDPCFGAPGASAGTGDAFAVVCPGANGLRLRRFDGPALPLDPPTTITQGSSEFSPRLAHFGGRWIVVWTRFTNDGQCQIWGRVHGADGSPLAPELQISDPTPPNTYTCNQYPDVAVNGAGDVLVVWDVSVGVSGAKHARAKLLPRLMVVDPSLF